MSPMYSWRVRNNLPVNGPAAKHIFAYEPLNQGFGGFLRTFNYEDRLHEIPCKTLILVGEEDWVTDKQHSQLMANKIPDNEFIIFPQSDHSMESDVPEQFFRAYSLFWKDNAIKEIPIIFFSKRKIRGRREMIVSK